VVGEVVLVRVFRILPRQQKQKLFKIRIICREENLSSKETSNAVGFNRNPRVKKKAKNPNVPSGKLGASPEA
jgi:hypothetical protein